MKSAFLFLCSLLFSGLLFGQTPVRLQINHQLGASTFQFGQQANNNNNVPFTLTRVQYYVGNITLTHDGGQQTTVPNTWFLVDAGTTLDENLGSFNITTLESITMGIGVEVSHNHLDPSTYPNDHPLAHQNPSMHWGWNFGYKFIAMEGNSGPGFNQAWGIHSIEDNLYHTTTITTSGIPNGNEIVIGLNADYVEALYDIDVYSGPVVHGGFGEAITLVNNFRDRVFTAATTVGVEDEMDITFQVGPNPVFDSRMIRVSGDLKIGNELVLTDISGKEIYREEVDGNSRLLETPEPGCYFLSLRSEGRVLSTKKVLVLE